MTQLTPKEIITSSHSGWFSSNSMEYWNSEVYWETLTPHENGWKFITSEDNYNRSASRYTIRYATESTITELSEFQEFSTIAEALKAM
jgi:hypothetical protein